MCFYAYRLDSAIYFNFMRECILLSICCKKPRKEICTNIVIIDIEFMSVYNCECCSFYTDRHSKLIYHFKTQKHMENSKRVLCTPPPTQRGQTSVTHRIVKENIKSENEKEKGIVPDLPFPVLSSNGCPTVFTLLEIRDNQIVSSRQVDANNSVIRFV